MTKFKVVKILVVDNLYVARIKAYFWAAFDSILSRQSLSEDWIRCLVNILLDRHLLSLVVEIWRLTVISSFRILRERGTFIIDKHLTLRVLQEAEFVITIDRLDTLPAVLLDNSPKLILKQELVAFLFQVTAKLLNGISVVERLNYLRGLFLVVTILKSLNVFGRHHTLWFFSRLLRKRNALMIWALILLILRCHATGP